MDPNQPQLFGVGLRSTHFPFLEHLPKIRSNWFEAISENYMNTEGRPLEMLLKIRSHFPVGLHGVSLSIGSDSGVRKDYLLKLKSLIDRVEPIVVSDHLCWAQSGSENSHDLLPMPLNEESFARVCENLDIVQTLLGRTILLENPSYYLTFKETTIEEVDFLNSLCKTTGCHLLLDLNNVYVNSINHSFDPFLYVEKINPEFVKQIHLGGPTQEEGFLFDTHATPVREPVWQLLDFATKINIRAPLIVEWDQDIPEFSVLEDEVEKARATVLKKDQINYAATSFK